MGRVVGRNSYLCHFTHFSEWDHQILSLSLFLFGLVNSSLMWHTHMEIYGLHQTETTAFSLLALQYIVPATVLGVISSSTVSSHSQSKLRTLRNWRCILFLFVSSAHRIVPCTRWSLNSYLWWMGGWFYVLPLVFKDSGQWDSSNSVLMVRLCTFLLGKRNGKIEGYLTFCHHSLVILWLRKIV